MKILVIVLVLLTCTGASSAEYVVGMTVDSSSNILMRSGGAAGTMTSLHGNVAFSPFRTNVSYGLDGGLLDRYEGIQFHYHDLELSYNFIVRSNTIFNAGIEYNLARYGDVTALKGYDQYGAITRLKSYITDKTLLRFEGKVGRRSYSLFETESFTEAESFLRLDRFYNSGTTLRGQLEAGIRRYTEEPHSHRTLLLGIRTRVARSLGERWGMWVEAHDRVSQFHSLEDSPPESHQVTDNPLTFDRIFLDDKYKYSSYGLLFHTKYLLRSSGSIQFETSVVGRKYDSSQTSSFWYLPPDGWKEWEWGALFTVAYRPGFFPAFVHPMIEVYHVNTDASVSDLSYDSTGVSLSFELF